MDIEQSLKARHNEKFEILAREESEKTSQMTAEMSRRGLILSGVAIKRRMDLQFEYAEKKSLAFIDSVTELIELGAIKPSTEWKQRLLPLLEGCLERLESGLKNCRQVPGQPEYAKHIRGRIDSEMPGPKARMRRRFELMFFDEGEKAKMNRTGPITIGTVNLTGILNLGDIVGDINQSINQIQNAGSEQVAEILKEISHAVLNDPSLEKQTRLEAIENLRTLAHEASLPSAERKLGVVKAVLAYIPSLLSAATDVLNYFHIHIEELKKFFGV